MDVIKLIEDAITAEQEAVKHTRGGPNWLKTPKLAPSSSSWSAGSRNMSAS